MKNVFRHIELIGYLIEKDFKAKFRSSFLGAIWAFLAPSLHYFVIGAVLSQFVTGSKMEYAISFLCGALPFSFVANSLAKAPWILTDAQVFFRKAPLPKEIFLIEFTCFEWILFVGVSLAFLIFGVAFSLIVFAPETLLIFLGFILAGLLVYGLSTILSVFAVFFRDIGHMMPVFIQTLFFISPVAYALDKAPLGLKWLLLLNPFTLLIEFVRQIVIHQHIEWLFLSGLGAWAILSIVVGQWFLNKMNHKIILYA